MMLASTEIHPGFWAAAAMIADCRRRLYRWRSPHRRRDEVHRRPR